jgi:hypothetical protein
MSNRDEFHLGDEIGFATIISRRGEELFPSTKENTIPYPFQDIITIVRADIYVCPKNDVSGAPAM